MKSELQKRLSKDVSDQTRADEALRQSEQELADSSKNSNATFRDDESVHMGCFARDSTERMRAQEEIRRINANVERRVLERTSELEAANTLLEASEEQLRALSAHLQSVREAERARIAREIHDKLGQELMALKMELAWLVRQLHERQQPQPLWERVRFMSEQVDRIIGTVRDISTELRPPVLDDLGLVAALEWQMRDFQKRTGITCRLMSELSDIDLDRDRATAMFRIFQEALTNAARHAGAKAVGIRLQKRRGDVILEVRDNGRGVSGSAVSSPRSLGLLGMRQRAAYFGGQVMIRGIRGQGTTVTVRLPLRTGRAIRSPQ